MRDFYRFCPVDGSPLVEELTADGKISRCKECEFRDYRNAKPCVGVAVICPKTGRILLGKRKHEPYKGMLDFLGGFVNSLESAEEAAKREILEETGLHIDGLGYIGTLTDVYGRCGEPTLNLCFTAQVLSGQLIPSAKQVECELIWIDVDQIPEGDLAFPHQRELLLLIRRSWRRPATIRT